MELHALQTQLEAHCRYGSPDFYTQLEIAEEINEAIIEAAKRGISIPPVTLPTPHEALVIVGKLIEANPPKYWSVAEAAKSLGVSTKTIYQMCSDGRLKHVRIGRQIKISPDAKPQEWEDCFKR